jgi:hypothetical protein
MWAKSEFRDTFLMICVTTYRLSLMFSTEQPHAVVKPYTETDSSNYQWHISWGWANNIEHTTQHSTPGWYHSNRYNCLVCSKQKKWPMNEGVQQHTNIMAANHMMGQWLVHTESSYRYPLEMELGKQGWYNDLATSWKSRNYVPIGGRHFSSPKYPDIVHPDSNSMGTGHTFPRSKAEKYLCSP